MAPWQWVGGEKSKLLGSGPTRPSDVIATFELMFFIYLLIAHNTGCRVPSLLRTLCVPACQDNNNLLCEAFAGHNSAHRPDFFLLLFLYEDFCQEFEKAKMTRLLPIPALFFLFLSVLLRL